MYNRSIIFYFILFMLFFNEQSQSQSAFNDRINCQKRADISLTLFRNYYDSYTYGNIVSSQSILDTKSGKCYLVVSLLKNKENFYLWIKRTVLWDAINHFSIADYNETQYPNSENLKSGFIKGFKTKPFNEKTSKQDLESYYNEAKLYIDTIIKNN